MTKDCADRDSATAAPKSYATWDTINWLPSRRRAGRDTLSERIGARRRLIDESRLTQPIRALASPRAR